MACTAIVTLAEGSFRVIATFLIKQAGLKPSEADAGAVTLIQGFGSKKGTCHGPH